MKYESNLLCFDDIVDIVAVLCHHPLLFLRQSLTTSAVDKEQKNKDNKEELDNFICLCVCVCVSWRVWEKANEYLICIHFLIKHTSF